MIEYKQCSNCYGNKTIIGIGFQKKECPVCNGTGRIVDNSATTVSNTNQSVITHENTALSEENKQLVTDLKNVSESHLLLNTENEALKVKQALHDAQLAEINAQHAEIKEQLENTLNETNARAEKAEQALADAKAEIKKIKNKGSKAK
jgi:chromosome segregation ATPase